MIIGGGAQNNVRMGFGIDGSIIIYTEIVENGKIYWDNAILAIPSPNNPNALGAQSLFMCRVEEPKNFPFAPIADEGMKKALSHFYSEACDRMRAQKAGIVMGGAMPQNPSKFQ